MASWLSLKRFLRVVLGVETAMVVLWVGLLVTTLVLLPERMSYLLLYGLHGIAPVLGFVIMENYEEHAERAKLLQESSTVQPQTFWGPIAKIRQLSWILGIGIVLVGDVFSLLDAVLHEAHGHPEKTLRVFTGILWSWAVFSTIGYLTTAFIFRKFMLDLAKKKD